MKPEDEKMLITMINENIIPLIENLPLTTDRNKDYYKSPWVNNHRERLNELEYSILNSQALLLKRLESIKKFIENVD